jgi:tellurite resistance protein TerC
MDVAPPSDISYDDGLCTASHCPSIVLGKITLSNAIPSLFPNLLAAIPNLPSLASGHVDVIYWLAFGGFVVLMLVLDLFVFHRQSHAPTLRESAAWTAFWFSLALAFNGVIWYFMGGQNAQDFATGYLVEWSLSMDNVFVFAVIFRFFRVPLKYQYRVLFWGILGAILMRLAFILAGAELLRRFNWVMVIFGVALIYTAIKLVLHKEAEVHPENNVLLKTARRVFRVSQHGHETHGDHFLVREAGLLAVTPLFLVLLVVESTDVLFAVDSVPAIFGITKVAFIVFTSNIFAILGLRALYFLLAGFIDLFRYLSYGLSAILGFIGVKMVAEYVVSLPAVAERLFGEGEQRHLLPTWAPLVIVIGLLAVSIVASILANWWEARAQGEASSSESSDGPADPSTNGSGPRQSFVPESEDRT